MNQVVLKVGGSLALNPSKLRALCQTLSVASQTHPIVVVPGGGEFADTVRILDARFALSCWASHRMSILGQDQYGLMLKDLTPNAVEVLTFEDTKKALADKKLPIFLPGRLFLVEDPLENSWDVTSDSIAAYIADQLGIQRVVFITDVDGIFTENPKNHTNARLLKEIKVQELSALKERTSVDKNLPQFLKARDLECFVVNGLFPQRVIALLEGQKTVSTRITF